MVGGPDVFFTRGSVFGLAGWCAPVHDKAQAPDRQRSATTVCRGVWRRRLATPFSNWLAVRLCCGRTAGIAAKVATQTRSKTVFHTVPQVLAGGVGGEGWRLVLCQKTTPKHMFSVTILLSSENLIVLGVETRC